MRQRELAAAFAPHYGTATASIIAAIVAAGASAYGASQQAAAAKKAALARASAGLGGGGAGGGTAPTVASNTKSIDAQSSQGRSLEGLATQAKAPAGGNEQPSISEGLGGTPKPETMPEPMPPLSGTDAQPRQDYSTSMGLTDNGQHPSENKADQYSQYGQLAASTLPLILSLTHGQPPQAQPLNHPQPYSYVPTAMSYRQRMGF